MPETPSAPARRTARRHYGRVTPEIRERIDELYAADMRPDAIAQEVGCSRASVYNHLSLWRRS